MLLHQVRDVLTSNDDEHKAHVSERRLNRVADDRTSQTPQRHTCTLNGRLLVERRFKIVPSTSILGETMGDE
jgi:hypothetical protein